MLNKNYVFFRDDDVYRLNERFLNVFNLFMKNKIPVVYAIIPGKLKNSLTELINKAKDKHPSLLDIAQHGWMHKNYNSADLNKKYEFGPKRSYGSQKKDIISGWLRLFQCFRDKLAPVFIPPYHGYDSSTLRIINELTQRNNFQIFSAGQKIAYTPRRFLDIPAQVSISSLQLRDKKRYRLLLKRLLKELRRVSLVGILLHHEAYNKKELGILQKLITDIKKNNANFLLLSDLSRQKSNLKLDITLEITNRCNLKCKHCNIWRETPKRDLTARDINRLINALSKHYFIGSVSLTGGEPFLNSEFNKIYGVLSKFRNNKTIESIGIYSNGYLLKSILGFLEANQDSLNGLDFGLSLEIGRAHV